MTAQQVRTVQDLFAAAYRGDVEGMGACLQADFSIDQAMGTPYAGHYKGLDGFLKMFGVLTSQFDIAPRNQVFHDCGDAEIGVVVTFEVDFTSRATGRQASTGNVELYRFDNDLIRHIDVYYKDAGAIAALAADGPVTA